MVKFDRRAFFKIGSIAPWGFLSWADVPCAEAKPKKDLSIIHLLLGGGLSHIDTFDMKPDGNPTFRSIFRPIPTNVGGLQICEHLPLTARQADKYTVIRSMTHQDASHEGAMSLMLTGHARSATVQAPAMGSVVLKELGPRNELPAWVSIPSARRDAPAGFLGPRFNAFASGDPNAEKYAVRDLELPMGVDWTQMQSRHSLLALGDSKLSSLETSTPFDSIDPRGYSAMEPLHSRRARKAFDIAAEPEALRDEYGRTGMGQGCLLARRLVEAGVRFVTVSRGNWDHHADIFNKLANDYLPELDRAYATLLEDLQQRGMLDSTIVLLTGEFGRTPEINAYGGRDHWPNCFSLTIAGGGIEGGRVWGSSDKDAMFVQDDPVEVPDLLATLYHKLGIDPTKEYISNVGRPIRLSSGQPLEFL
jgi:hypothetical protein